MNKLLISIGPDIANLRYATGFCAPDPVVFVQKGRKGFLLVPMLEQGRANKEAQGITVVTPNELRLTSKSNSLSDWCEGLLRHLDIREVVVSKYFPHSIAVQLKRKRFKISVCEDALFPNRSVKSETEIKKIKEVQRAAARAMKEAIDIIRQVSVDSKQRLVQNGKCLTSEQVRQVIASFGWQICP